MTLLEASLIDCISELPLNKLAAFPIQLLWELLACVDAGAACAWDSTVMVGFRLAVWCKSASVFFKKFKLDANSTDRVWAMFSRWNMTSFMLGLTLGSVCNMQPIHKLFLSWQFWMFGLKIKRTQKIVEFCKFFVRNGDLIFAIYDSQFGSVLKRMLVET